jgi:hypothetical protein
MKMSREQLKALVKECLLELLSEGLGDVASAPRREPVPPRVPIAGVAESRNRARRVPEFDPRLDTPVGPGRTPTAALKDAIKRNAGGNPIMESIFADTARTTLPAQLAHGDVGALPTGGGPAAAPGGPVQQEQFNGEPEQVFGEEAASRWASLAFMDGPSKKTA